MTTLLGDALLTPDPATLVVRLAQPDAALLAKLAEPYSYVVEQSVVSRYGVKWDDHLSDGGGLGTSGMYALRTSNVVSASSRLTYNLTASRSYWGARPRLRTVIFDLREYLDYHAPDQPFVVAATDDLDMGAYPPRQPSAQSGGSALRYLVTPARTVAVLAFNLRLAPTNDLRVRQALALAIDKTALAPIVSGRAVSALVPPGTGDYPTGPIANAPLTGDVAQARALWQSYVSEHCGGDAARCPAVTLNDFAYGDPPPMDQALIKQWQAALPGIRITPFVNVGLLTVNYYGAASDYPMVEDYPDPQDWLLEFTIEPRYTQAYAGSDTTVYGDDTTVDALVARAEATPDPASRLALYHQAEMTLLNDVVVVPIAQQQDGWGINRALIGVPANPSPWIAPSDWARMYLIAPASK